MIYSELQKMSDKRVLPITEILSSDDCPAEHFAVATLFLGIRNIYLFNGELEQADAEVVGRVERRGFYAPNIAYRGNHANGGEQLISGLTLTESLAMIIA